MKLIVGLGNPGKIYLNTRHNIGFCVIKALSQEYKIALRKEKGIKSLSGKGKIGAEDVVLATPLTYMNLSGIAVIGLLKKYRIGFDDLLVVCDDLDLELGKLRIRPFGSAGGHRGLQSVIETLASQEFARLRIGIGRPQEDFDAALYVLKPFNRKEKTQVSQVIARAVSCCEDWVKKGITSTMNSFNKNVSTLLNSLNKITLSRRNEPKERKHNEYV